MATFSQGIELVGLTKIELDGDSGTTVESYTVPSGFYAEVSYVIKTVSTTGGSVFININTRNLESVTSGTTGKVQLTMLSGDTIQMIGNGSGSHGYVAIKLYKNP